MERHIQQKTRMKSLIVLSLLFSIADLHTASGQELYTARSYWEESTRLPYLKIKQKQIQADSLTQNELVYLRDYEIYLQNYYSRMPEAEKERYQQMRILWDQELGNTKPVASETTEEIDLRTRDRLTNGLYGFIYGGCLVAIFEADDAAAAGLPLIMAGAWQLGPVINPKKYENITTATIRASNTGKFLGMLYGASLGTTLAGNTDAADDVALGGLVVGSIALGEIGFQMQKKQSLTHGHIETLRHYGIVGPWLGVATVLAAGSENANVAGFSILAGGAAGLAIGNQAYKKYPYTRGDMDAITSLSLISTGIGFTAAIDAFENGSEALILIPAAGTVIGTLLGQKAVRGVELTRKQGSTINLAAGGGALVGLGLAVMIEAETAALALGIPSACALVMHQVVFKKFKRENLTEKLQGDAKGKRHFRVGMKLTPENYFINKRIPVNGFTPEAYTRLQNPLFKLTVSF
jgi:hypothetical protein